MKVCLKQSLTFYYVHESTVETEFNLNRDFITEPIFRHFFSINESLFDFNESTAEKEFNLNCDLITEPVFCDFFTFLLRQ